MNFFQDDVILAAGAPAGTLSAVLALALNEFLTACHGPNSARSSLMHVGGNF